MILGPVSVFKNGVFIVRHGCKLFRYHIYAVVIAAFQTKAFRNIDTQCFESAPFWCRSESEFPFWYPSIFGSYHMWENLNFFLLLVTALQVWQWSFSSLSMVFRPHIANFLKKYCLSTLSFAWNWFRFGSGKITRIRPDPDPQHC